MLRQGRTTGAQQRALQDLFPKYGLEFSEKAVSAADVFQRKAPLVLEIGSGMGETTAAIAVAHPEADFIAVEVHGPGVGSLLNRIEAQGLRNLRVIRHDAVAVLQHMIPDGALAAAHIYFPDPWPKKRHHKRRLLQAAFLALLERKMAPGGIVHAATDWPDYAEQIALLFSQSNSFSETNTGFVLRPTTKFEARGLRLGHPIRDLYFRRR